MPQSGMSRLTIGGGEGGGGLACRHASSDLVIMRKNNSLCICICIGDEEILRTTGGGDGVGGLAYRNHNHAYSLPDLLPASGFPYSEICVSCLPLVGAMAGVDCPAKQQARVSINDTK